MTTTPSPVTKNVTLTLSDGETVQFTLTDVSPTTALYTKLLDHTWFLVPDRPLILNVAAIVRCDIG